MAIEVKDGDTWRPPTLQEIREMAARHTRRAMLYCGYGCQVSLLNPAERNFWFRRAEFESKRGQELREVVLRREQEEPR